MKKSPLRDSIGFFLELLKSKDGTMAEEFKRMVEEEQSAALRIVVGGGTGTGKSSLTNRITGANFPTSHTEPCTKEPQVFEHLLEIAGRVQRLSFCDLPGFSESAKADFGYLQVYLERFLKGDAALYTVPAGTRALEYERMYLRRLMESAESDAVRREIVQKLILVMTKADTIVVNGPWTLTATPDRKVVALPDESTREVLKQQARYAWLSLFEPFADYLVTRVLQADASRSLTDGALSVRDAVVEYQGILDTTTVRDLGLRHPSLRSSIQKLYDRQHAVVCSSRFSYGLEDLLLRIFEHASQSAVYRLSGLTGTGLRCMEPAYADGLPNVRIADPFRKRLVELKFDWLENNRNN